MLHLLPFTLVAREASAPGPQPPSPVERLLQALEDVSDTLDKLTRTVEDKQSPGSGL